MYIIQQQRTKGGKTMRRLLSILMCVFLMMVIPFFFSTCGGGGKKPDEPGMIEKTYDLGGGVLLKVRSPVTLTVNLSPASGSYPDGWSKVKEVGISGTLGSGQSVELIYESVAGFETIDKVGYVDVKGNWCNCDSTIKQIAGNTITTSVNHVNTVFGVGAFATASVTLNYSGSSIVSETDPIYVGAYNVDLDCIYESDEISVVPSDFSFILPQGSYIFLAFLDNDDDTVIDTNEVYEFYDGKSDPQNADTVILSQDQTITITLNDDYKWNLENIDIYYPDGDTLSANFTASGTYTGDVDLIMVYVDDVYYGSATLNTSNDTWSFVVNISGLSNAMHTLRADAYKSGSLMDSSTASFIVNIVAGVDILYPDGDTLSANFTASGTYTGDVDPIMMYVDDVYYGSATLNTSNDTWSFVVSISGLSNAMHTLRADAYEGSNLMDSDTTTFVVSVGGGYANVQGTFSIPSAVAAVPWIVVIDTNTTPYDGYVDYQDGGWGAGLVMNYYISDVPAGIYYIYALVDNDYNEDFSIGDYFGFYGGSGTNPPASANVTVPYSGTLTLNNFVLGNWSSGGGTTYYIETFPNGSGDWADTILYVYDSSLQMIAQNDDISDYNYYSRLAVSLTSGQTYYIQVYDYWYSGDYYSIRISDSGFGGSSSGYASSPDMYEPDDSYSDPTPLVLGVVQNHSLNPYGESDWYVFTAP
jgi:hypothetical protein